MKKRLLMTACCCHLLSGLAMAASEHPEEQRILPYLAAGGPDAYGYTWADSNEPGGPVFNWIDITGIGTQVTGLADDNSVAMIPMGMNFQYYWITFSEIKIGSNGWFSFDDVSNVAHCFPTIPSPGGAGDNLVAPFMTDLNFTGAGNPGEVYYYHDDVNDLFIVSFINVPWWVNANPAFIGSNTFQLILSGADNNIIFQYEDMDQVNFNDTGGCLQDLSIGFENTTGNVGLTISTETVPADNYAIQITYPDTPLLNIVDIAPLWNQNADNKGFFALETDTLSLATQIKNTGNTDAVSDITVAMEVQNDQGTPVYNDSDIVAGLLAQDEATVNFASGFSGSAGAYQLIATTTSGEDINPGNNSTNTEVILIDGTVAPMALAYTEATTSTATISWNGGTGGMGTFFQPPVDGWQITSVEMFVQANAGTGADYTVGIYANDNGAPGTLLGSELVPEGSYTFDTWVMTTLSTPIPAPVDGFFVSWEQNNASGVAIGRDQNGPKSRHTYEFLGGQWAEYRDNEGSDIMIRANLVDLIYANGYE